MQHLIPLILLITTSTSAAPPAYPDHTNPAYYFDSSHTRRPLTSPDDWSIRRGHILAHFQAVAGPLPPRANLPPLDFRIDEEVTLDNGLLRRKLSYQSSKTHRVAAYLFLPATKPIEKRPAILALHPTGPRGKEIVSLPGVKENRAYALELAQRGYIVIAPDYPTFGDYQIDLTTNKDFESGTLRAIWDNLRAIDLLQSLPQTDPNRIAAIGHSLGGHNAIFTALFDHRIKAVVSSCGFTRFHKYYEGNLKGWTSPRYMPRIATEYNNDAGKVPFDFPELIASLAPRPFFTNSPLHDANFEVSGVKETIAAARPIYELFGKPDHLIAHYPDAAHDFPDELRQQAYRFLDHHLRFQPAK